VVTCPSPVGVLGLSVCYDLRFPELYRALADRGSDVLLVPSAFTLRTGLAHWTCLLRARAIETQCYVIAAAQTGRHNDARESYGHACVIDPWGTVLVELGDGACAEAAGSEQVATVTGTIGLAHIDLDYLQVHRERQRDRDRQTGSGRDWPTPTSTTAGGGGAPRSLQFVAVGPLLRRVFCFSSTRSCIPVC
jgi:predicted amidohydrolase